MSNRLYIGNLQWSVTEQQLKEHFSKVGKVISVNIIMDRETNRSRGFGFVEMETTEDKEHAIKLNDSSMGGRNIRVKEAEPEKKEKDQSLRTIEDFIHSDAAIGEQIEISVDEKNFILRRGE